MTDQLTTSITISCHCKTQQITVSVPNSSLPLAAKMCHCDSCRHASGCLYTSATELHVPLPSDHKLAIYDFSSTVKLYFCPKCSQKIFWKVAGKSATILTASLPGDVGLIDWNKHIFVADTKDGGITPWLKSPSGKHIPRWATRREGGGELSDDWPASSNLKGEMDLTGGDKLPVRCHCGGVDLQISRPDYSQAEEVPWHVEPTTRRKWLAMICVCDSCRLTFSCDLVPLAFVDLKSISSTSHESAVFPSDIASLSEAVARGDPSMGTLVKYQSSKEACRYSCKKCSASVFYACTDRPNMVDLAPGLIESPDGARAEGMLWWKASRSEPVGDLEDVKGTWREELCQNLIKDLFAYREQRGWEILP